jgi:HSP20 family molecular chaperone IbpA
MSVAYLSLPSLDALLQATPRCIPRRQCRPRPMRAVQVVERADRYLILADASGLRAGDIAVELERGRLLRVSAGAALDRVFRLPADANAHAITAHIERGLLFVSIARIPDCVSIAVTTGQRGASSALPAPAPAPVPAPALAPTLDIPVASAQAQTPAPCADRRATPSPAARMQSEVPAPAPDSARSSPALDLDLDSADGPILAELPEGSTDSCVSDFEEIEEIEEIDADAESVRSH